jgi:hypothetical protein
LIASDVLAADLNENSTIRARHSRKGLRMFEVRFAIRCRFPEGFTSGSWLKVLESIMLFYCILFARIFIVHGNASIR